MAFPHLQLIRYFIASAYLLLTASNLNAQNYCERPEYKKANSNWIHNGYAVGDGISLNDFRYNLNESPPAVDTIILPYSPEPATTSMLYEGRTSVSDTATGELLFFTNGLRCFNSNFEVMENGDSLLGSISAGQGCQIVPMIDSPGKYYLFNMGAYEDIENPLRYSVIDMSLDGGLGGIVAGQKNILLDAGRFQEVMMAVPGNNCDIWLVTHAMADTVFKCFHITREGIDPTPVLSSAGNMVSGPVSFEGGGISISPDRRMLSIGSYSIQCTVLGWEEGLGGLMVARFDPDNGMISDGLLISSNLANYSSCFSPDGTKLYAHGAISFDMCELRQYDVTEYSAAAIIASEYLVSQNNNVFNGIVTNLRRWNDTIIISYDLAYIASPDESGAACNLVSEPYFSGQAITNSGLLGNDVAYPFPKDTVYHRMPDTSLCPGTSITLKAPPGHTNYRWNNGSESDSIVVRAEESGIYWVFTEDPCHSQVDTFFIGPQRRDPDVDLGSDTILCNTGIFEIFPLLVNDNAALIWSDNSTAESLSVDSNGFYWIRSTIDGCVDTDTLKVSFINIRQHLGDNLSFCIGEPIQVKLKGNVPEGADIIWSNGSAEETIIVKDTGITWVTVTEPPCIGSDSVLISYEKCDCQALLPNAFSPNGDGLNDVFTPLFESDCIVGNYAFSVYSRWGQRIFVSFSPGHGWDGTFEGKPVDAGNYMFDLVYKAGTKAVAKYSKGDITLIR